MKIIFLFTSFILCRSYLYSQDDPIAIFNSHVFPCDTNVTTLEANFCSGEKFAFADSLLNNVYKKILKAIDTEIQDNKRSIMETSSKKDSSSKTMTSLKVLREEMAQNDRLKKSIIASQKQWIKYRDSNAEAVGVGCETGTACTTEVNQSMIHDTLERIEVLQGLYNTDE